jgi:hypothetical protein
MSQAQRAPRVTTLDAPPDYPFSKTAEELIPWAGVLEALVKSRI